MGARRGRVKRQGGNNLVDRTLAMAALIKDSPTEAKDFRQRYELLNELFSVMRRKTRKPPFTYADLVSLRVLSFKDMKSACTSLDRYFGKAAAVYAGTGTE